MKRSSKKQQNKALKAQAGKPVDLSKNTARSHIIKHPEKSSILVLIFAAAVFFILFFWIHSEDILKGRSEIFNPYRSDEIVEFEKGSVTEIVSEDMEIDEVAEGAYVGSQKLSVIVKSGRYKGETMTVMNYFGPLNGVPLEVGDGVAITVKTHANGEHTATVYEFNRIPIMAVFLILFFVIIILVGGLTGLKSLVGLVCTFICLFTILIPLIIKGASAILTTFFVCVFIALVCFTILGGIHRKTISAFLGTITGAFLAMIFALIFQYFAKIDGLRLENAEPLLQLKQVGATINIRGLLVAGIIISALGAVMDVAMSISSALEEVHAANPALSRNDLFKSGMNIGRDMVGTMTNTLILAFLGSEFSLMLFFFARDLTFYHLYATPFIVLETISGVAASIGMILSIPLTSLISSTLISRSNTR